VVYKRTNQGGSVLSFVIIAICLAIGVIGTVYFVQQRGEQARRDAAIALADKIASQTANNPTDTVTETNKTPVTSPAAPAVTPPASSQPATTTPAELPVTGIDTDIVRILMLGTLVAAGISYIRSRRILMRSL
jgi:type II secretory pathway pseudopilin PulG